MKRLVVICILFITAVTIQAATQQYYNYPTVKRLYDNSRVLIYANNSGSRNITGAQLKSEVVTQASVNAALATATNASPLIKQAGSGDNSYVRQFEVRNASGTIVAWINTIGQMVFGTPKALAVSSVYPANGATNVSNGVWFNFSTAGLGWQRINTTTPQITYNKDDHPAGVISPTGGSTAVKRAEYSVFDNFSGIPGAVYTITTNRLSYTQLDGETTSSCGSAMTDVGGVCTSTFQMAQ